MTDSSDHLQKLGDIAARAGLRRIHMLAWRDLDDVEAGGSEVHAPEVARLWAEAGIEVVIRTSFAQGHPSHAHRDGYQVVRKAGRYLVFPRAAASEATRRYGERDALVEIWNGMPFFSPLWARGPRVVFLHHVHADMWKMVLPPNLAKLGDTLESRVAPKLYRRSRMITLSPSSKREMLDIGFRDDLVDVVPPGVDPRFSPGGELSPTPLVVGVGRLVPVKRFDRLIRAVVAARQHAPELELVLVGTGPDRTDLESLVHQLGVQDHVHFAGRISDDELVATYRRAWAVASSSVREGWGMTLTEAAACGTPAVATRIPGHVDAIAEGQSGLLADDDAELARHLAAVATDHALRDRLRAGALVHASQFTWTNTATQILEALADEALGRRHRPGAGSRA
ncbi:glycosyltransferase family 4 protein [Aquihabitans sp. G128]|uniref:glycosyltransferase family 4 protein n=1 Tax=Aquihabitans sp. G128 TaxID=2849779 RepID=UPI001C21D71A|nr:glycosyltransferase family 4 protein [Aquihabitans sp. G128]QXC62110.1 glycosyltransferase family 4 protein [Aquihabitans sp. G128]